MHRTVSGVCPFTYLTRCAEKPLCNKESDVSGLAHPHPVYHWRVAALPEASLVVGAASSVVVLFELLLPLRSELRSALGSNGSRAVPEVETTL